MIEADLENKLKEVGFPMTCFGILDGLQDVIDWFRNEHRIIITIHHNYNAEDNVDEYGFKVFSNGTVVSKVYYGTYEESQEMAIDCAYRILKARM